MSGVDDITALARTLCHRTAASTSTHKAVLLKNAFQCHGEQIKLNIGSPKPNINTDNTLCASLGIRVRVDELQPANDPFIVDNIFKSPKKRRRGLLSWSTIQAAELALHAEQQAIAAPQRDFQRQARAKSRRRSILGTKYSFSSMRRRHAGSSGGSSGRDHSRSASDPTFAVASTSPSTSSSAHCESAASSSCASATPKTSPCPASPRSLPSSTATTPEKQHKRCVCQPLFPKLPSYDSGISPPGHRHSDSFARILSAQGPSTLRGVPGHPAPCVPRTRPTPYISVSALRLVSSGSAKLRVPEAVAIRGGAGLRSQRCTSMPCSGLKNGRGGVSTGPVLPLVERQPLYPAFPGCTIPLSPFQVVTPPSKFDSVKNSLDLKKAAAPSSSPSVTTAAAPASPKAEDEVSPWLWPTAFKFLRRIVVCGGGGGCDGRRR